MEFQAAVRAFWMRLRKNAGNLEICSFIREFLFKSILLLWIQEVGELDRDRVIEGELSHHGWSSISKR